MNEGIFDDDVTHSIVMVSSPTLKGIIVENLFSLSNSIEQFSFYVKRSK